MTIAQVASAAGTFTPSIALAGTYIDNIDLAPPSAPKSSDWVGQLLPRLQWNYMGPRFNGSLDYSAQILFFHERTELNDTHHSGTASGSLVAYPDLFYVDGSAAYLQQIVDPTQPRNADNLFSVANTSDEFDTSLSPYLKRDFGETTGLLRYTASTASYSRTSTTSSALLQDSASTLVNAQYSLNDIAARFAWSLDARSAHTTFDVAEPFRADRISADGSLGVVSSLRLIAAAGAETNILENSADGGLDSGFWSAGFKWAPNDRSSFEARAGHRFFGNSYSLSWLHMSRLLTLQSSYTEEPTTDSGATNLIDFVPGSTVQAQSYLAVARSSATYSPYIRKMFDASVELHGRRTTIKLSGYRMRRDFTDPQLLGNSDTTSGAELLFSRDLGANSKLGASARLDVVHSLVGFNYRDRRLAANYTHRISAKLNWMLEFVQLQRSGDSEYRANIATAKLQKTF